MEVTSPVRGDGEGREADSREDALVASASKTLAGWNKSTNGQPKRSEIAAAMLEFLHVDRPGI